MASTQVKLLTGAAALLLLSGGAVVGYKVMSPPPPPTVVLSPQQQITNLAEAEWKKRFESVYALAPDQIVKLVPPPMIPERQQYWNEVQNGHGSPLPAEASFTFKANGPNIHWSSLSLAPNTLSMALQMGAGLKGWEIDSSIPAGMPFPGDWVFREKATTQQVMDALAGVVSQRLSRQVRFVKRLVMREAIIARGAYHYVPLPGHPNDNAVQLTDGKKFGGDPPPYSREETLAELFDWVSIFESRKMFDETGAGKTKVKVADQQVYRDTAAAVRNVAAQTSIRFDREPRQMDVWFMVDSTGTTLPTTQQ